MKIISTEGPKANIDFEPQTPLTPSADDGQADLSEETGSRGPLIVELICERGGCVIYEYALATSRIVGEQFKGRVKIKPVVRRGSKKNVERYLELCKINGHHLSVPTILINGKLAFTNVPGTDELRNAIEEALKEWGKEKSQ
ncbi:MAG: hypothetical protein ACP5U1_11570 [Desulfomonilaceae bacterium]